MGPFLGDFGTVCYVVRYHPGNVASKRAIKLIKKMV